MHSSRRDQSESGGSNEKKTFSTVSLPLPISAGLRNSFRNPARFVLTMATVAIGAVIFMMAMNMRSSIVNTAAIEESTVLYDLSIAFEEDTPWSRISWMEQFGVVNAVELWPATRARLQSDEMDAETSVLVIASPADSWAIRPNLVEGEWITDLVPEGVVATHRFLNRYPGLEVGDVFELSFGDRVIDVRLIGVEKRFGPPILRMPLSGYLELTGAEPGQGRVALLDLDEETARDPGQFIPLLESHFSIPGLKVAQVSTSRLAARVIRNHLDVIVVMLGFVAAVMMLISGLGMASGTSTSVIERTRELGVLRAIGATPLAILKMLSVEALTVATAGCLLALLLADPLSRQMEAYFGNGMVEYPFDHRFSWEGMLLCFLIVAVLSLIATLGPARLVTRGPVRTAVSYE